MWGNNEKDGIFTNQENKEIRVFSWGNNCRNMVKY